MNRMTFPSWLLVLAALVLLGCRANEPTSAGADAARPSAGAIPTLPAPSGAGSTAQPLASAPPFEATLPKLKPILKRPFPAGADEATVCEAIDSHEPDLWVRFGHIVPAYITGAVYVLETGPETKDKMYRFIQYKYVYGYYSQQASCRGSLTLLYVRRMFDKSEYRGKPFGREHLGRALEKELGVKTRESFQLTEDQQLLSQYCRVDAQLCDQLYKLDIANEGEGLCGKAANECRFVGRDEQKALAECRRSPTIFACLQFAQRSLERVKCQDEVTTALCPE